MKFNFNIKILTFIYLIISSNLFTYYNHLRNTDPKYKLVNMSFDMTDWSIPSREGCSDSAPYYNPDEGKTTQMGCHTAAANEIGGVHIYDQNYKEIMYRHMNTLLPYDVYFLYDGKDIYFYGKPYAWDDCRWLTIADYHSGGPIACTPPPPPPPKPIGQLSFINQTGHEIRGITFQKEMKNPPAIDNFVLNDKPDLQKVDYYYGGNFFQLHILSSQLDPSKMIPVDPKKTYILKSGSNYLDVQ